MVTRNQEGEFVFSIDETDEFESALKEVLASTAVGQDYKKNYYTKESGDKDAALLVDAAVTVAEDLTGKPLLSRPILERALSLLIDSGKLQPRVALQTAQLAEPEIDNRPKGRDGKPLTQSQLLWKEYREWSETASSSERKLRMQSDPGYATFVRKAYQAEMDQEIGGAVTPVGEPEKKIKSSAELVDFVHKYNRSSRDSLKPCGGYVQLDGQPLLYSTFISLVERAAQARLI